jgi:hypothetical protein
MSAGYFFRLAHKLLAESRASEKREKKAYTYIYYRVCEYYDNKPLHDSDVIYLLTCNYCKNLGDKTKHNQNFKSVKFLMCETFRFFLLKIDQEF